MGLFWRVPRIGSNCSALETRNNSIGRLLGNSNQQVKTRLATPIYETIHSLQQRKEGDHGREEEIKEARSKEKLESRAKKDNSKKKEIKAKRRASGERTGDRRKGMESGLQRTGHVVS